MHRLVLIIAIVLAVASVLGSAMSSALAADVDTALAARESGVSLACDAGLADHGHAPAFKPCGKLRNGMAVQCHPDPGLLPVAALPAPPRPAATRLGEPAPLARASTGRTLFRPPRGLDSLATG